MGLTGGKLKGAALKHGGGDARHDGLGFDVEMAIKLIRAPPATNELNTVAIDASTEEEGNSPPPVWVERAERA